MPLMPAFQFQNGAIKSRILRGYKQSYSKFQFQNGAIKSSLSNSRVSVSLVFQFQNGAIKSHFFIGGHDLEMSFNSKMVRLKGKRKAETPNAH